MKVHGTLERAQLEPRGTDHSSSITGGIWFLTTNGQVRYATGSTVRVLVHNSMFDESTIEYNSGSIRVKTSGIQTAHLLNAAATTAKIADGAITKAKLAALGQQLSSSCGSFTSTSASATDVTNLTVTITTTGRPVFIGVQADGGSSAGLFSSFGTGTQAAPNVQAYIVRGSTVIAVLPLGVTDPSGSAAVVGVAVPCSSIWCIDVPSAGTYTYKIQVLRVSSNTTVALQNAKLIAYEM